MTNLSDYHQYLIFGKLANSLSEDEVIEIENLLRQDVNIQEAFNEILSGLPQKMAENKFGHLDQDGYWEDLKAKFDNKSRGRIRKLTIRTLAIAAGLVGIFIFSWFLFFNKREKVLLALIKPAQDSSIYLQLANGKLINLSKVHGQVQNEAGVFNNDNKTLTYKAIANKAWGINTITVPVGRDYKIMLADGSEVWLNSATQLKFPFNFTSDKREITIAGEAYCKITKDSRRPFIVHLPGSNVHVLGTEFNVNSYDSGIVKVALVQGKVSMEAGKDKMEISPGFQAVYNGNDFSYDHFDAERISSWQTGIYYFDESDLQYITRVLNRWYGVRTLIDNPHLNKKRFAGMIDKNQPLNLFLGDLRTISKIESYFDKDGTLHFK